MKILWRKGSRRIIQDKEGRYWLTRRKKRRHDSRRKTFYTTKKPSVVHIPICELTWEGVESIMGVANHRCEDGHYPDINFTP